MHQSKQSNQSRQNSIPKKEKKKCEHRINKVALMCMCCVVADPECTRVPRSIRYREHSFLVHCLECKKALTVMITLWGETLSYTEFDWVEVYSDNPILAENKWYPKTLVDDAKRTLDPDSYDY